MKNYPFLKILIVLLLSSPVLAQKPQVEVSFTVDASSPFFERYEDSISTIVDGALPVLVEGLNTYIGFAEFGTQSAVHKLEIDLSTKFSTSALITKDHYLFFELEVEGDIHKHEWEFLNFEKFITMSPLTGSVLDELSRSWKEYLDAHYNLDLVTKMFRNLPLLLPDTSHYYIDEVAHVQEAILPFQKETLSLDIDNSEFLVDMMGQLHDGGTIRKRLQSVFCSGIVEAGMNSFPQHLLGCVRIGLSEMPVMKLIDGEVYITNYHRKLYKSQDDLDAFFNENE